MFLVAHNWNALDWTFLVLMFLTVCAIAVQMDCAEVR